jgi:transposase
LELAQPHIQVLWLPKHCWNLNLIERLWKHLKASRIANVLFASYRQFVLHVEAALANFAEHPDLTLTVVTREQPANIRINLLVDT